MYMYAPPRDELGQKRNGRRIAVALRCEITLEGWTLYSLRQDPRVPVSEMNGSDPTLDIQVTDFRPTSVNDISTVCCAPPYCRLNLFLLESSGDPLQVVNCVHIWHGGFANLLPLLISCHSLGENGLPELFAPRFHAR
jgi:hypothetical protein